MKSRKNTVFSVIAALALCATPLLAQDDAAKEKPMSGKPMMMQKMGGDMKMPMMQHMMSCPMNRQIVPLEDGGVLVVVGKKMMKYDANLELVKEGQIDISQDDMKEMMQQCPHCSEMMKKKSGAETDAG